MRTPDGRAVYAFPGNNQKLFLILGIINLAWVAFKVAVDGEVPLLGVALLILAAVGWYFMGKGQTEARQQFDGDAGYAAAPAAASREPRPRADRATPLSWPWPPARLRAVVRVEHPIDLLGRQRLGEQPALRIGAAERLELRLDRRGLDAFGRQRNAEPLAERGDRLDQRLALLGRTRAAARSCGRS